MIAPGGYTVTSRESSSLRTPASSLKPTSASSPIQIGNRVRVRRTRLPVDVHVGGAPYLPDDLADDRHRAGQQASLLREGVQQHREEKIGFARPREQFAGTGGERDRRVGGDRTARTSSTPASAGAPAASVIRYGVSSNHRLGAVLARTARRPSAAMRSSSVPYRAVCQARSAVIAFPESAMISFIWMYVGTRSLQPAIRTKKPSGTTPRALREGSRRARGIELAQIALVAEPVEQPVEARRRRRGDGLLDGLFARRRSAKLHSACCNPAGSRVGDLA